MRIFGVTSIPAANCLKMVFLIIISFLSVQNRHYKVRAHLLRMNRVSFVLSLTNFLFAVNLKPVSKTFKSSSGSGLEGLLCLNSCIVLIKKAGEENMRSFKQAG